MAKILDKVKVLEEVVVDNTPKLEEVETVLVQVT